MRHVFTAAAVVALLASFFEAPYSHLHANPASEHAREHHHGNGLAAHSHLAAPHHGSADGPAMQSTEESSDTDAFFVAQASSLTRSLPLPAFLPVETSPLTPPNLVRNLVWRPTYRSHDPPSLAAAYSRPPPA